MEVDWQLEGGGNFDLPESHCSILTHVVYGLLDQVDPPQPPPSPPPFPKFFLRASLIGKPFSGKTTVLSQLTRRKSTNMTNMLLLSLSFFLSVAELGIVVLCPSQLVERAVQQYLSEKTTLEAQLMTSHDEETPVISSGDDQLGEKAEGSGLVEEGDSNNGDIDGESPAIEEGDEGAEGDKSPQTAAEAEEEEEKEEESEEQEEQTSSEDLPPYFSEVGT